MYPTIHCNLKILSQFDPEDYLRFGKYAFSPKMRADDEDFLLQGDDD